MIRNKSSNVKFTNIRRTLQSIRANSLPAAPKTAADICVAFTYSGVLDEFGKSHHNEKRFFFRKSYEHKDFSYCVFASDTIIELINANIPVQDRQYLLDDTLKVFPRGVFKQFLVVYVEYLEKVLYTLLR